MSRKSYRDIFAVCTEDERVVESESEKLNPQRRQPYVGMQEHIAYEHDKKRLLRNPRPVGGLYIENIADCSTVAECGSERILDPLIQVDVGL